MRQTELEIPNEANLKRNPFTQLVENASSDAEESNVFTTHVTIMPYVSSQLSRLLSGTYANGIHPLRLVLNHCGNCMTAQ